MANHVEFDQENFGSVPKICFNRVFDERGIPVVQTDFLPSTLEYNDRNHYLSFTISNF